MQIKYVRRSLAKPASEIDDTSSPTTVYINKNLKEYEGMLDLTGGKEAPKKVTFYDWDVYAYTRAEYESVKGLLDIEKRFSEYDRKIDEIKNLLDKILNKIGGVE